MPRRKKSRRANGEGSVTERPDGTWMGQITVGWVQLDSLRPDATRQQGKQERKTVYARTARECREKLDQLRQEAQAGQGERADPSVSQHLDYWLLSIRHKVEESTYTTYARHVRTLKKYLGHRKVRDLTDIHVLKLYEQMGKQGYTASEQSWVGSRLRQALAAAVEMGLLKANPAKRVARPRVHRAEMRCLTPEQVPAFLRACSGRRMAALPVVALDSGCRLGELLALEWADWNPATREITVVKSLKAVGRPLRLEVGPCKTAGSRRKVLLSAAGAAEMQAHRVKMVGEGHASGPVFCNQAGHHEWPQSWRKRTWAAILKEAGLRLRFHDLRHSCATLLLLAGIDIKSIAARLGHANPRQLLQTYAHVLPAMHGRMASAMDGFLAGQAPEAQPAVPALKILEVS